MTIPQPLLTTSKALDITRVIKWDHFDILAKGKTDYHCKIRDLIYSARTWASFQRQLRKWKADTLLIYPNFIVTVKNLFNLGSCPFTFVIYKSLFLNFNGYTDLKMYVEYIRNAGEVLIKKMWKFNMFITAVCVLFLIKLRWPKNKSI